MGTGGGGDGVAVGGGAAADEPSGSGHSDSGGSAIHLSSGIAYRTCDRERESARGGAEGGGAPSKMAILVEAQHESLGVGTGRTFGGTAALP